MLAAALLASLSNPTGVFFSVVDRIWTAAWLLLCTGVVILLLAWILRHYGAPGVSFAFVAGFALHLTITLAVARRVSASPGR